MAAPLNTWQRIARLPMRSLAQLGSERSAPPDDLMQGLIAAGALTVFRSDPGVPIDEFMYLLAQCLAVKHNLGPFVVPNPVKVNLFVGAGAHGKDGELASLLDRWCDAEVPDHESAANLGVYHRQAEGDPPFYLDTAEGQEALLNSLLPKCQVVLLDDVSAWLSPKHMPSDDAVPLSRLCETLHNQGTALVVFERARNAAEPFRTAYRLGAQHLIRLVKDECAPEEVGGGLGIVRERMRYSDKVPAKIQWWYTVIDGAFKEGWEWRDPDSTLSAHDIKVAERRVLVGKYAAAGMTQKQIAAELKVNQGTVSRDLAAITAEAAKELGAQLPSEPTRPAEPPSRPADPQEYTWD